MSVLLFHSYPSLLTCLKRKYFLAFPCSSRLVFDHQVLRCFSLKSQMTQHHHHHHPYFPSKTHPTSDQPVRPIIAAWDVWLMFGWLMPGGSRGPGSPGRVGSVARGLQTVAGWLRLAGSVAQCGSCCWDPLSRIHSARPVRESSVKTQRERERDRQYNWL